MAIKWEVKITPLNIERKEIALTATYTDDADPANVKTGSYTVLSAIIKTSQQKLDVMDNIWGQYQADLVKQTKVSEVIGDLEAQAVANLEARI